MWIQSINYTAADWARDAAEKIIEIESRGKVPILVGGTGFYLRTLRQPLFESPKTDEALRERLRTIMKQRGVEHLHGMLGRCRFARIGSEAARHAIIRVLSRALEVYFQTGERLSNQQPNRAEPPDFADRILLFVLNPPRDELYAKINVRTEPHFAAGLVEEVAQLLKEVVPATSNALEPTLIAVFASIYAVSGRSNPRSKSPNRMSAITQNANSHGFERRRTPSGSTVLARNKI